RVVLRPLAVHAGGLVWAGPYLYVAGTRRGLFTCRIDDIVEVEPGEESFGHRFVLPVRFAYDAQHDRDQMRYLFLSLDRSTEAPHLVAGEYGRDEMTRRIVRYPLDPGTYDLRADTTSRGRWRLGALQVGQPGSFRTHRLATPVGPEDLCYFDDDLLWSLSEYPGHRYVFAMERSQFD
ncbi:MAG: hypothetical protein JF565_00400, partial [Propionibacteriales bacterium]|nr:hypothetical protein [Propionibacteriales bacterium]